MAAFALAFTAAANHTVRPGGSRPPSASASRLADDWRTLIPARLAELADAWRDEAAWSGMTRVRGQDPDQAGNGRAAQMELLAWSRAWRDCTVNSR
jgi:hypothetical protein